MGRHKETGETVGHIGRQERHQGNRRRHRETGGDIRRQGRQEET